MLLSNDSRPSETCQPSPLRPRFSSAAELILQHLCQRTRTVLITDVQRKVPKTFWNQTADSNRKVAGARDSRIRTATDPDDLQAQMDSANAAASPTKKKDRFWSTTAFCRTPNLYVYIHRLPYLIAKHARRLSLGRLVSEVRLAQSRFSIMKVNVCAGTT